MEALMVIALICHATYCNVNGVFCNQADLEMKCQKDLVACYEKSFPKPDPSDKEWVGAMKDCVKNRKLPQ